MMPIWSKIEAKVKRLERRYDPERDLFEGPIQMNVVDQELLKIVCDLADEVENLRLEVDLLKNGEGVAG